MVNALDDSPLEALAFNYVRLGFLALVNNLWTWIAVITAALSFWRMHVIAAAAAVRCSASSLPDKKPHIERDAISSNGSPSSNEDKPTCCSSGQILDAPSRSSTAASIHQALALSGNYGATKGRFTIYYDDGCRDITSNDQVQEAKEAIPVIESKPRAMANCRSRCGLDQWSGWEKVLRTRNWDDMGWYRHQDSSVLNGSVVRLWDDARLLRW